MEIDVKISLLRSAPVEAISVRVEYRRSKDLVERNRIDVNIFIVRIGNSIGGNIKGIIDNVDDS